MQYRSPANIDFLNEFDKTFISLSTHLKTVFCVTEISEGLTTRVNKTSDLFSFLVTGCNNSGKHCKIRQIFDSTTYNI